MGRLDGFEVRAQAPKGLLLRFGPVVKDSNGLNADESLLTSGRVAGDAKNHLGFVGQFSSINESDVEFSGQVPLDGCRSSSS